MTHHIGSNIELWKNSNVAESRHLQMSNPLFTEHDKQYLSRFLGGELPHPNTPFEARAFLELAAAACNPEDPQERAVRATFAEWADEIDPRSMAGSTSRN